MLPKLSFEYYDPKGKIINKRKPLMSTALFNQLTGLAIAYRCEKLHIVHLGTVGDERHRKDNPKSYHLHTPPDAIDVVKLYGKDEAGRLTIHFDFRNDLIPRIAVAKVWTGKAYHSQDATKHHLHLQSK